MLYDVIIIGAGPAGLSAALILGRCRRQVLILDAKEPRNRVAAALHGYLTQDGVSPWALRERGRADVARYPTVTLRETKVKRARRVGDRFEVVTGADVVECARLLLLATGRVDPLPDIPGFDTFYGRGVHHCPYCDGWEHRGQRLAVFGQGERASDLAVELLTWSRNIVICSHGAQDWQKDGERRFEIITEPVAQLEGSAAGLSHIRFASGATRACEALFFCTDCTQRSSLPEDLGCTLDPEASVVAEDNAAAGVAGLYIAGNVRGGVHLAITAAAEGAEAAIAMNEELLRRHVLP